jgi:[ribosomal protein S18]-alanine N-acetyltransferase
MNSVESPVQIRSMTAADIDRVMEIAESLSAAPAWPRRAYLDALSSNIGVPRIALVAAAPSAPDQPVPGPDSATLHGFVIASLLPPRADIETLAVAAPMQRRKIGLLLLDALAAELKTAGVRELLLEVRASNQVAIAFYRAAGFVPTGRRNGYYTHPEEDALLMSAKLD